MQVSEQEIAKNVEQKDRHTVKIKEIATKIRCILLVSEKRAPERSEVEQNGL